MRLDDYMDYPADLVNLAMEGNGLTLRTARELFHCPVMGGLDNNGVIAAGTEQQIRAEVRRVLQDAPTDIMLGADCTIPAHVPLENMRWAIEEAHAFRP